MPATRETTEEPRAGIGRLGKLIALHAPYDGSFELRLPGVDAIRLSRANAELTHAVMRSAVCISRREPP